MVNIDQKSFNEDMSDYLEKIRKSNPINFTSKINPFKRIVDEEVPELSETRVHIEYEEPSFFRKLMQWRRRNKIDEVEEDLTPEEMEKLESMEGEIEAIEDEETELESMEEELEEKKQSLLSSMFNKLNFFKRTNHEDDFEDNFDPEEFEEKKEDFNEDIKDVLKITHTWLEKLPVRYKKAFKVSDDFKRYKEVLTKYGLVRETGSVEAHQMSVVKNIKEEIVPPKPKVLTKKEDELSVENIASGKSVKSKTKPKKK